MRIALVNLWHASTTPRDQIARDALRRELARGLTTRGHTVTVIQEHLVHDELLDEGVRWVFVPPSRTCEGARALLGGRRDAFIRAPATHMLAPIRHFGPDIIHTFDLASLPTLGLLARLRTELGAKLVVHDHGGAPLRRGPGPAFERRVLAGVDRLLFTTRARAQAWIESGALPNLDRVVEVFETSSPYTPGDAPTGDAPRLSGAPALLHLGRLDPVKDPLTTLAALRRVLLDLPGARLHMAWRDAPMLGPVCDAARDLPVELLGPRMNVEALLRGADLLVQASTREVCGIAVLEALATGTAPVLSDIPPFRRLTDGGRIGRLFPVGDPEAMAAAIADAWAARQAGPLSEAPVREWFDAALSFEALTDAVEATYRELGARRGT